MLTKLAKRTYGTNRLFTSAESSAVFVCFFKFQHATNGETSPAPKTGILVPGMQAMKDKVRSEGSVLTLRLRRDLLCAQGLSRCTRDLPRPKQYAGSDSSLLTS
ncbi:hypothetical protein ACN42_g11750 [Penicillium freii]|uniref:Uncharacterized protein n=1 Tax=Penicillium freii TaxID=48697 RepID=A0A101M7M4_PENFR|nr:hypothetical protein ACN42_g11750 [Penicillium freii]